MIASDVDTAQSLNVLIIEDDEISAEMYSAWIGRDESFSVFMADRLSQANDILARERIDVILTDLNLPDSEGMDTCRSILEKVRTPVVVLTGIGDVKTAQEAMHAGAQDYLVKGEDGRREVLRALRYAIERHGVLERLEASEQRFRDFADVAADWFWEADEHGVFSWVSDRIREKMDAAPERIVGRNLRDLVLVEEDAAGHLENVLEAVQRREPFHHFIYASSLAPGKYFSQSGKSIFAKDGRFSGYRGVGTDCTQQVIAEKVAARVQSMLLTLLDSLPFGLMLFNAEDHLLFANEKVLEILGLPGDAVTYGMEFKDVMRSAGVGIGTREMQETGEKWQPAINDPADALPYLTFAPVSGDPYVIQQIRCADGGILRIVRPERMSGRKAG